VSLSAYLRRIGFEQRPRPDLDTLRRLHRAHLQAIPYENLDVQLGRGASRDPQAIFDKLVTRRRGGWCYEMCGLHAWALESIGFAVTPLAGGVGRRDRGEASVGNHLVLLVELDRPYLADVGFGNGLLEPIPIVDGERARQGIFEYSVERLDDAWWRLHNPTQTGAESYDFTLARADEALLDERCAWQQTSPDSPFVQNVVVQRHVADGLVMLRGKVLTRITAAGAAARDLASAEEYVDTLVDVFDLRVPEAATLWPAIEQRHATWERSRS
jgi:N-hydroxyarylamine O-acetyltransferase